jgi:hypothetical protein
VAYTSRMRRWEAILLAAALVCGSSALAQEDFGKKIASPEEYNAGRQQSTIYLARGVTLELRFGCGRAEIDGEMRPQPDQAEWPQLQAWILEQIEREHPLGRKLRSNLDPIEALMILNGRSPAVDEYEHGYFQTIMRGRYNRTALAQRIRQSRASRFITHTLSREKS